MSILIKSLKSLSYLKSSKTQAHTITTLPNKLISNIFSYLTNPEFLSLRATNRKLRKISFTPIVLIRFILLAKKNNQENTVLFLSKQLKKNIDAKNEDGMTPLMIEAKEGNLESLRYLIDNGANLSEEDYNGKTALIYAIIHLHYRKNPKFHVPISSFEPNDIIVRNRITNTFILTPLSDNLMVIKELLANVDKSEAINKTDNFKNTPLMYAAICCQKDVIKLLLDYKAEINSKNIHNATPLMFASMCGNTDAVELLIDNKAEVNVKDKDGKTPLMFASMCGNKEVAKLLLDNKAEVNAEDKDGKTPLMFTFICGNKKVAKLLLDRGANDMKVITLVKYNKNMLKFLINYDSNNGNKILHYAHEHDKVFYQLLLENGAIDYAVAFDNDNKLIEDFISALDTNDERKLNNILNYVNKTNIDNKNREGKTLLLIATERIKEKTVDILLKKGANPNCEDNFGTTPLLSATEINKIPILISLINNGANIDAQDRFYKQTPLMLTAILGYFEAAEVLIKKGANIDIQDKQGNTALQIAKRYSHNNIAVLIDPKDYHKLI